MIFLLRKNLTLKRCRMLNKKVLNFLLNVKHTVVDDVKIFDDDSIVFMSTQPKVNNAAVASVAARPPTMMPAGDSVCGGPQTSDSAKQRSVRSPTVSTARSTVLLPPLSHGHDIIPGIPLALNIQLHGLP